MISASFWRKALVTMIAAGAFVSLYEVTALDSKYAARHATMREATALPAPGSRLAFSATAYCKGNTTTSGVAAQSGVAAADPELLPVGSVVDVDGLPRKYNGIYTILDTGPSVQGRQVELHRGAGVRPPGYSRDRAAPRVESGGNVTELTRSVPQAGRAVAAVRAALPGRTADAALLSWSFDLGPSPHPIPCVSMSLCLPQSNPWWPKPERFPLPRPKNRRLSQDSPPVSRRRLIVVPNACRPASGSYTITGMSRPRMRSGFRRA